MVASLFHYSRLTVPSLERLIYASRPPKKGIEGRRPQARGPLSLSIPKAEKRPEIVGQTPGLRGSPGPAGRQ